ncbi:hypothetical protein ACP275_14G141300 [Erythranthe tilingii]
MHMTPTSRTRPSTAAAAVVTVEIPWGTMRGLDTFSQLVCLKSSVVACGWWFAPPLPPRSSSLRTAKGKRKLPPSPAVW